MANRLANATSPYLQQHAGNPVDWWEWGPDAFEEARLRDAPVLLSVGYAACHWCHDVGMSASGQRPVAPAVKPRPAQLDSPVVKRVLKYGGKAQVWAYRRTNGRIGGKWRVGSAFRKPVPVLILDHVGRKSGRRFSTPLLYLVDGANLVVVASSGGMAHDPQWFRNLCSAPNTQVQVGAELRRVHARVVDETERARLWPRLVELYADFASYATWTDRRIPVVVLEPR